MTPTPPILVVCSVCACVTVIDHTDPYLCLVCGNRQGVGIDNKHPLYHVTMLRMFAERPMVVAMACINIRRMGIVYDVNDTARNNGVKEDDLISAITSYQRIKEMYPNDETSSTSND